MTETMTASIICTDLDAETISAMTQSLKDAGFGNVKVLNKVPPLEQVGDGDTVQYRMPHELADSRFILLDEFVGGRSAFELHSFLKPAAESSGMAYGILLQSPPDTTIFAAWVAGFDLCVRKEELDLEEFGRFCRRILSGLTEEESEGEAQDPGACE